MTWFLHWVSNLLLSTPVDLILSLCIQLTPFKTIWPDFSHCVAQIDCFQDHLTWFSSLCTQFTPLNTIWPDFMHCVPNWLLSTPFDLILSLCTQLTTFKTIWPNFIIVCSYSLFLRPFDLNFCIIVFPNWFLSRPFYLILSLGTQLTPFKTIWPEFCIVYPINSFQDHLTQIYQCVSLFTLFKTIWPHCIISVPYWLLSRPFDLKRPFNLILSLGTQLTAFKTIWPDFCIVYPIDSFQVHMTCFL